MNYQPIKNSTELWVSEVQVEQLSPPPDLSNLVSAIWEYSTDLPEAPIQVFPSGCASLGFSAWGNVLSGYFYAPIVGTSVLGRFEKGVRYFGASFKPGAELVFKRFSLAEAKGTRLDIHDVWPGEMTSLASAELLSSRNARYQFVASFLRSVLGTTNARGARYRGLLASYLREPFSRIHHLAAASMVNERGLRRYCRDYVGLSPKELEATVQVQTALQRLVSTDQPLGQLANDAGYADQAHFTRRFCSCLGDSPLKFKRKLKSDRLLPSRRTIPWDSYQRSEGLAG